ncbi:TetR family transcriptional regulator [Caballeronia arvi]|uniref:TetR family transcriptional regulator n=1 Tax=Caballeronia arvi TaxID=1777135 RepID=A0A158EXF6_9BURK|nr:TetR/AcrR family transcriptional regulator [Caballeronia arvi]SAL11420.1 TetR family transcriptional regulator [Caballeronia arvi]
MQNPTPARKRGRPAKTPESAPHPYHHGSLPDALLHAAETVLRRDGLRGLTLRAIAREAGVSHTAPQHHFGDTAGVLAELAASGHRRLAQSMQKRAAGIGPGAERSRAIAHGYIDFAVANPDLFRLMSRNELLDTERPSLVEARRMSAAGLADVFDSVPDIAPGSKSAFGAMGTDQTIAMASAWAHVHGLASLLIDNRLSALAAAPGTFGTPRELVDAVIDTM